MTKEQEKIPASKVARATRIVQTGVKIGVNYAKHYAQKALKQNVTQEDLDHNNATDIFKTLSELKGSALKVAQMLSMERNLMPSAYTDVFALAQHNAPPLSGPLIVKTFLTYAGKTPQQLFDLFDVNAAYAASIGQVHKATKNGQKLAVKIQYPGVADSVKSDLKLVRPFAIKLLRMNEAQSAPFFEEIEEKLLEEANYELELQNSVYLSQQCQHLPNLYFAQYFPDLSAKRYLTMTWLNGTPLNEWLAKNPTQQQRNQIGQAMWDFYAHQVHKLHFTHSDPHPGNFLVDEDNRLGVLDFGCVKKIPDDFYDAYFAFLSPEVLLQPQEFEKHCLALNLYHADDTPEERNLFEPVFVKLVQLLSKPFETEFFNFGHKPYFEELYAFADHLYQRPEIRYQQKIGTKHTLYLNRTFFGLYRMLHDLQATIHTHLPIAWAGRKPWLL